jgi:hypothetical protein
MTLLIGAEVAALHWLTAKELRQRFAELFGQPARTGNKTWAVRSRPCLLMAASRIAIARSTAQSIRGGQSACWRRRRSPSPTR